MKKYILVLGVMVSLVWAQKSIAEDAFLKALQDTLAKLGNPWIAGETPASRLSAEEKQKLLGGLIIPEWTKDMPRPSESSKAKERRLAKITPPSAWDWRNKDGQDWMTQPKVQGCGDCWDFAWTAAHEARSNIISGIPDYNFNLSEQFILSCNPYGSGCNGGNYFLGDWLKNEGVPDEPCFSYAGTESPCGNRCSDWEKRGRPNRVTKWGWVNGSTPSDAREAIKNEVMNGPVAVAIRVKEDFLYYQGGVYTPILGKSQLNHGVCIYGWNDAGSKWLIKNSWAGQSWVEFGYGNEGDTIRGPSWAVWMEVHPRNSIALYSYKFNEPHNNLWEPGDTISIIDSLLAVVQAFTNVSATLSTTDPDVNITTAVANFGSIPSNEVRGNATTPYVAIGSASAIDHDVSFNLHITADGGYTRDFEFQLPLRRGMEYANIRTGTAGTATLTVTPFASIGFDTVEGNGSGFIYNSQNTLYFASMGFGNSETYVIDNWYTPGANVDHDWVPTVTPIFGRLRWVSPPEQGDTMLLGYYDDKGTGVASKNIVCQQYAWGFKNSNYDDFVIMQFNYTNNGTSTVTGLYSAIFADFDIGIGAACTTDAAGANDAKYLAWVSNAASNLFAGATLLYPTNLFKNASSLANPTYTYPVTEPSDTTKYKFMNRTLNFGTGTGKDFSVVTSAGPFDLTPGSSQIVAFAIVGGTSKTAIENNSDSARAIYLTVGTEENESQSTKELNLSLVSNPILKKTTISFSLPTASDVTINIYDITGRMVQELKRGTFIAGTHKVEWDVSKMSAGVFFVKLNNGKETRIKKAIVF
ncbi:MAG: T9SS type A sorting domain-containing protein [Candidatus Stahlbacteria bacterium]|nr:T9SS type A sorting domain-containing protein [Candidatus Stahlbacteria bacterium]